MKLINTYEARPFIERGDIIAYPTEAVYGLGCDPFNKAAVERLLALKQRPNHKGLILLIADESQLIPLVGDMSMKTLETVRVTWPGPVTWIFPKSALIPEFLCGKHDGIAIRLSAHPVARQLCEKGPLVSTSANLSGHEPAMDIASIHAQFPYGIAAIVQGALGGATQPSAIFDVQTGKRLR